MNDSTPYRVPIAVRSDHVYKQQNWLHTLILITLLSVLAAGSARSEPSFPHYPLVSGAGSAVPPNVILILDDSGSMQLTFMATREFLKSGEMFGGEHEVTWGCYDSLGNPWESRQLTSGYWRWAGPDDIKALGQPLCDNPGQYLNKSYDEKLKIFDTGRLRSYANNSIYYNPNKTYEPWRTHEPLPTNPALSPARLPQATITKVSNSTTDLSGELDLRNSPHSHFFIPKARSINGSRGKHESYDKYRIGADSNGAAVVQMCNDADTSRCTPTSSNWVTKTPDVSHLHNSRPPPRSQAEEIQNFANWFHYHSTRMKMAKAGASEAFGELEEEIIRIGYDAINTNTITYPIRSTTDGGLFRGKNREDFYKVMQAQVAEGNTPMRGALARSGEYYRTAEPYKNEHGVELSCRRNYAVLVTDGEWTQENPPVLKNGFSAAIFDENKKHVRDEHKRTIHGNSLNQIAHFYWAADLRPSLKDDVPTTDNDRANWQHMNLFGISVGMQRPGGKTDTPPPQYRSTANNNDRTSTPRAIANEHSSDETKIEDLASAAGEGRGQFFLANDTAGFADALRDAFDTISGGSKSSSGIALTANVLSAETDTYAFNASFTSGKWLGELKARNIGGPNAKAHPTPWVLSTTFASGSNKDFSQRTILRGSGAGAGGAVPFDKNMPGASVLARTSAMDAVTVEDNIDWLKGVTTHERKRSSAGGGGKLRRREPKDREPNLIGDIVHSTPAYASDSHTVYIGANDGMLHGIDARNGKVIFSYVPGGVDLATLGTLSSPRYEHRFFVDGSIDVMPKAHHGEKTLLLAALGRGGRGVFSLDISNPNDMKSEAVLWDDSVPASNSTYLRDMGYVLGPVHLRRTNGAIVALIPNGIDSPSGRAALIVRNINADGSAAAPVVLATSSADSGNGLMALALADLDHNGTVDLVYGGDLKGNVWRWDFRGGIPDASTQPAQLLAGNSARPITGGLIVSQETSTRIFIGFGTGRFISSNDQPTPGNLGATQRLYGIVDQAELGAANKTLKTLTDADLTKRNMHTEASTGLRAFDPYEILPADSQGWYVDLPAPERVIYPPNVAGPAMYISSAIPSTGKLEGNPCDSTIGGGFLYAINLFTGTSPMSGSYWPDKGKDGEIQIANGQKLPVGGFSNTFIPTGIELVVDDKGVVTAIYERGDGELVSEKGLKLPDVIPEVKGRLSWREVMRF